MNNFNASSPTSANPASHSDNLQTLGHVAFLANRLAKQLSGKDRAVAYQIKSEALSALVVSGVATANGLRPDNTLGLDFFNSRLHCPYSSLTVQAQTMIDRRSGSIPRTAPMIDLLSASARSSLEHVLRGRAA
jgi:hypothetical protein